MLDENCSKHDGPMGDFIGLNESSLNNNKPAAPRKGGKRREQHYMVRDMISCLALCHNVTPTYPDPNDPTIREFQASSPDEVALVKFADTLGLKLLERD